MSKIPAAVGYGDVYHGDIYKMLVTVLLVPFSLERKTIPNISNLSPTFQALAQKQLKCQKLIQQAN